MTAAVKFTGGGELITSKEGLALTGITTKLISNVPKAPPSLSLRETENVSFPCTSPGGQMDSNPSADMLAFADMSPPAGAEKPAPTGRIPPDTEVTSKVTVCSLSSGVSRHDGDANAKSSAVKHPLGGTPLGPGGQSSQFSLMMMVTWQASPEEAQEEDEGAH